MNVRNIPTKRPPAFQLGRSVVSVAAQAERTQRYVRVLRATVVMAVVLASGTAGYHYLTNGQYSLIRYLYMTVVTVSTVGYSEVIPADDEALMLFNMGLILFGGGGILYFISAVTAIVIEGDLLHNFWRSRMNRRLDRLRSHVILVGVGQTGRRALSELINAGIEVVFIDADAERVEVVVDELGESVPFVIGDSHDEHTLRAARIDRAAGLIAALQNDRENLYLTVTARALNPSMRIISKVERAANVVKFREVGADGVVNTARIGGQRMARELQEPALMAFVDGMLATERHGMALTPVTVDAASSLAGKRLVDASLQDRTGCMIMGLRGATAGPYDYQPGSEQVLEAGGSILALGSRSQLRQLRRLLKK